MEIQKPVIFSLLFIILFFSKTNANASKLQTYIIHLRQPINTPFTRDLDSWYTSFLPNTTAVSAGESRIIHKYTNALTGFAAKLTEDEVNEISKKEEFLNAYPDRRLNLLTTHTPTFLGLRPENGFWKDSSFGKGVIIGMIDSGAKNSHVSFNDEHMPPPPSKWKGECQFDKCNNKIIGARSFVWSSSPDDGDGHGTHAASTAAGSFVTGADVLGKANGTAVGMAPLAHLAIYRVCDGLGCMTSNLLAGLDAAIGDGVDVVSISLGGNLHRYDIDPVAIGTFAAVEKGIFVSCAAGNGGPGPATLNNEAPWMLTVGASTVDRIIKATVRLGDGQELDGESLFQPDDFSSEMLPLVYPKPKPKPNNIYFGCGNCYGDALRKIDVKGKAVICERPSRISRVGTGEAVKGAGGAAMILLNMERDGDTTLAEAHVLPASNVNYVEGSKIMSYFNSSKQPTASIVFKGTVIGDSPAPAVASFSSRGPSIVSPFILKPDVIGPGVNVLASWPYNISLVFPKPTNARHFNIISGTSMSTPHLSGIAALVKSVHPDWSPAAIKSAIMTSSYIVGKDGEPIRDEQRKPASLFALGAGHVNPTKAADPGLVYDLNADDYIGYLCGLRYTDTQVESITKDKVVCGEIKKIGESELNYPSIAVALVSDEVKVSRTVTNVGEAREEYSVKIDMPKEVVVEVVPEKLNFSEVNEKREFTISFKWSSSSVKVAAGHLSWVSDKHVVRSPIVVMEKSN